jgi:hypothetical protein
MADPGNGPTQPETSRFRVFLSYSHADEELVRRIAAALTDMGIDPLWDRDIRPGSAFTESIKEMIELSHLFIPVLTENSAQRAWVQQDTGYALALKIPVLPLAIGKLPDEMIAFLQPVTVREDLSDFNEKLQMDNLEDSIMPKPAKPAGTVSIAEWPETRTDLLVRHANWVIALGKYGPVRHQAVLSSFSIPDKSIDDPVWKAADGHIPQSDYFHHLQLQERRALELHVRQAGGKLIIDPTVELRRQGGEVRRTRLETLSEFLGSLPEDCPLSIIMTPASRSANIIIVGNYFAAEALVWRTYGYYQTVFHSHPTVVLERIKAFDEKFKLLKEDVGVLTPPQAKEKIDAILKTLRPQSTGDA